MELLAFATAVPWAAPAGLNATNARSCFTWIAPVFRKQGSDTVPDVYTSANHLETKGNREPKETDWKGEGEEMDGEGKWMNTS